MRQSVATLKAPVALPAEPPEWWRVLPKGEILILGEDKPLIMDDTTAPGILAYFKALGRDMVVDYEHQTEADVQAPAAGWIKELSWRPDGLWARTEWTQRGAGYIAAKEYRYFSPVLVWRKPDRRITALVNVALTNEPRTRNIEALAAKLNLLPEKEGDPMKDKLIALLKLSKDAADADVEQAVSALAAKIADLEARLAGGDGKTKTVAAKAVMEALGLSGAEDEAVVVAKIKGLAATDTAAADLSRQVSALSQKLQAMEVDTLTQKALKAGQTSPEELAAWGADLAKTAPDKFEKIVLSRPPGSVIPVGKTKVAAKPDGSGPDEDQVAVNKMLGITDETWKKYGPKEA